MDPEMQRGEKNPNPLLLQRDFFLDRPVQEMESTPGPWYSTMAPVPPFTVRMPATFKMTSLGDVQPERQPVSFTPITFLKKKNLKDENCEINCGEKVPLRLRQENTGRMRW